MSSRKKLTTQDFIEKARKVHGCQYDYSKVHYVTAKTKVIIIDPKYGEFEQSPDSHLRGTGHPTRGMKKRASKRKKSTQQFVEEARHVHDDLYDYSKVEYVSANTKVTIIDPEYGEFTITPSKHLSGGGCQKRVGRQRYTTDEWIQAAHAVHGDIYNYSKVQYVNAKTKVIIIDPEYGEFEQTPDNHLQGKGHPRRSQDEIAKKFKKTKGQFIKDARKVHGDLYDYSKVKYVNNRIKVTVIDPDYGEFEITPTQHLSGGRCPKRVGKYRYNTQEWIEEARKVHGDFYDYSKVYYVNANTNVIIIDPEFGEFEQEPTNHLMGAGSPQRAGNLPYTTESFIEKAQEIHGDLYDYTKVKYVNNHTKVIIIDPKFGEFEQTPGIHLGGAGSPQRAGNLPYTTESFIEKARKVHGCFYDYSKVKYLNYTSKVTIIDPEYGEFEQIAGVHLQGGGCPLRVPNLKDTAESFIDKARKIHGDLYDYSKVEYIDSLTPVVIIDPEFGEFLKSPSNHLRGQGSPARTDYGFDPTKPAILYYLRIHEGKAYKIGITNRTVAERFLTDMEHIQVIKETYYEQGRDAYKEEQRILKQFVDYRYKGEPLLKKGGNTEIFCEDVLQLDQ